LVVEVGLAAVHRSRENRLQSSTAAHPGFPRFFAAAAPAFKEPLIGRKLPSAFARAALVDVAVRITATPDRRGGSLMVMRNMVSYVRTFRTLPDDEVDRLFAELERAVESGTYLFVLPQFLITGTKPSAR
jgi:hypothetical protein